MSRVHAEPIASTDTPDGNAAPFPKRASRLSSGNGAVVPGVTYLSAATVNDVPLEATTAAVGVVTADSGQKTEETVVERDPNTPKCDSFDEISTFPAPQGSPPTARTATLADFNLLCVLGRGTYGSVLQVRHIASGEVFAMKVFDKKQLVKMKQVTYTRVERDIMTRIHHPFLVDLKFCFQTPTKVGCWSWPAGSREDRAGFATVQQAMVDV